MLILSEVAIFIERSRVAYPRAYGSNNTTDNMHVLRFMVITPNMYSHMIAAIIGTTTAQTRIQHAAHAAFTCRPEMIIFRASACRS